jgi:hypothetical protein
MNNIIRFLLYFLAICLIAYMVSAKKAGGDNKVIEEVEIDYSVPSIIERIAPLFDQDPQLIYKITWCESNHKVVSHDGGRARNVTGIHNATFKGYLPSYEKEMGETLDIHSTYDQIKMMSFMFSKGEKTRRLWSTYRAYTNGGTYTFYSKLLQGTYTSRCK